MMAYRRDIRRAYERVQGKSNVIPSPYGDIEYSEGGVGPHVLVVHGSGGGFDQGELIAQAVLGDKFHWVAPSRFGYLQSTFQEGSTFDDQAHAYAALLDHLGIDRFKGIGLSGGGDILLHLSTKHPERVEKMVLDGTSPYFSEQTRQGYRDYTPTEEDWGLFRQFHYFGDEQIKLLIKQFQEMEHSYDDVNFTPSDLSRIQAETLIILGDRDKYISVDFAVEMYESIPESHLWIVPNAGHAVTYTHVDVVKKGVLDFLTGKWEET